MEADAEGELAEAAAHGVIVVGVVVRVAFDELAGVVDVYLAFVPVVEDGRRVGWCCPCS